MSTTKCTSAFKHLGAAKANKKKANMSSSSKQLAIGNNAQARPPLSLVQAIPKAPSMLREVGHMLAKHKEFKFNLERGGTLTTGLPFVAKI